MYAAKKRVDTYLYDTCRVLAQCPSPPEIYQMSRERKSSDVARARRKASCILAAALVKSRSSSGISVSKSQKWPSFRAALVLWRLSYAHASNPSSEMHHSASSAARKCRPASDGVMAALKTGALHGEKPFRHYPIVGRPALSRALLRVNAGRWRLSGA